MISGNEHQALEHDACALLAVFSNIGVAYLLVGHQAILFYGKRQRADALGIWIEPTAQNFKRVAAALNRLGTPLTSTELLHLAKPRAKLRLPHYHAELRTSVQGLEDFAGALDRADMVYVKGHGHPTLCELDLFRAKHGADSRPGCS